MGTLVLVADDEKGALTLISIMLERSGFSVIQAGDAYSALEILRSQRPALFVLDVMMPGMDGIELTGRIRQLPEHHLTPIIILSARSDPESVEQGRAAGANSYLSKPILQHELLLRIREVMGNSH